VQFPRAQAGKALEVWRDKSGGGDPLKKVFFSWNAMEKEKFSEASMPRVEEFCE